MRILVTGGLGYNGSHSCVELLRAGEDVVVLDNLYNAKAAVHDGIRRITGKDVPLYVGTVLDTDLLHEIFRENEINAVMHFAGLKGVQESCADPVPYYRTNVAGVLSLLEEMDACGCRTLVYSSSASVYGLSGDAPLREDSPLAPATPYSRTKRMVETVLEDLCASDSRWSAAVLRYFNPVSADSSGLIGQRPEEPAANLLTRICRVALGMEPVLRVTGTDYDTPDGSGVRDFIHVSDLARGHVAALRRAAEQTGCEVYNLGRGMGCSVLELVAAFERVTGHVVPWESAPRRPGDLAMYYADVHKAQRELHWRAEKGLDAMCADAWRYAERVYG